MKTIALRTRISLMFVAFFVAGIAFGQENDDMYFSKKDRKKVSYDLKAENNDAEDAYEAFKNDTFKEEFPDAYSSKNVNPEYIARYQAQAEYSDNNTDYDAYVTEEENPEANINGYYPEEVSAASPTVINNYYNSYPTASPVYARNNVNFSVGVGYSPWGWGSSFAVTYGSPGYAGFYDPFWGFYDPFWGFYDPFFGPSWGWSMSMRYSYGWGPGWGPGWGRYPVCYSPYIYVHNDYRHATVSSRRTRNGVVYGDSRSTASNGRVSNTTTPSRSYDSRSSSRTQNEYYNRSRSSVTDNRAYSRSTSAPRNRADYSDSYSRSDYSSRSERYSRSSSTNARTDGSYNSRSTNRSSSNSSYKSSGGRRYSSSSSNTGNRYSNSNRSSSRSSGSSYSRGGSSNRSSSGSYRSSGGSNRSSSGSYRSSGGGSRSSGSRSSGGGSRSGGSRRGG